MGRIVDEVVMDGGWDMDGDRTARCNCRKSVGCDYTKVAHVIRSGSVSLAHMIGVLCDYCGLTWRIHEEIPDANFLTHPQIEDVFGSPYEKAFWDKYLSPDRIRKRKAFMSLSDTFYPQVLFQERGISFFLDFCNLTMSHAYEIDGSQHLHEHQRQHDRRRDEILKRHGIEITRYRCRLRNNDFSFELTKMGYGFDRP